MSIRDEIGNFEVVVVPLAIALVAWTLLTQPIPDGGQLVVAAGAGLYVTILNGVTLTSVRFRYLRYPEPWPQGGRLADRGTAANVLKQVGAAALLVSIAIAAIMLLPSHKRTEGAYVFSGIGLGTALGVLVAYLRVLRLEHRLGVRLYRERPRGVFGFGTSRVGYAGPPPIAKR